MLDSAADDPFAQLERFLLGHGFGTPDPPAGMLADLFLGYGLRDWNLRMILGRIWEQQALPRRSWAVQREVAELEARLWEDRNVTLLDMDLAGFVHGLRTALDDLGPGGGAL